MPAELRERDRGGAHLRRDRVFPSPRAEARARRGAEMRRGRRPVFVDDSGRRRRVARIVGVSTGGLALLYVTFVGLTFAGVGRIDAAGLGQLTNPAGEQADVGQDPVEATVPAAVSAAEPDPTTTTEAPASPGEVSDAGAPAGVSTTTLPGTTTTLPATTTTTTHGNGGNTPNSTVPDKGGPPTSRPNG